MNLIDMLPSYYAKNEQMNKVQSLLSEELVKVQEGLENTIDQCFVDSADDLLSRFEKLYGIETDISKDIEIRRETIKSKMAGTGTFTKSMLINTLKAFEGGSSEIIEQFADYIFSIKFNDEYRVPSDEALNEIYNMVKILKPAHLNFNHTFTYNWWDRKELKAKTWNDFSIWNDLRQYKEEL